MLKTSVGFFCFEGDYAPIYFRSNQNQCNLILIDINICVSSSPSINDIVKDYVVDVGRTLKVGGGGAGTLTT